MKNNIKYFIILFLVGFMSLTLVNAYVFTYPIENDTVVGIGNTKIIVNTNVTDTFVLFNGELSCELTNGYCEFLFANTEFSEGYNSIEFEIMDSKGNININSLNLFYYNDIQSLADSAEEHNVKTTWLNSIKDWILKTVNNLFFKKGDNLYATKYTCIEGIVDLTQNHTIQCNSTGMYIIG